MPKSGLGAAAAFTTLLIAGACAGCSSQRAGDATDDGSAAGAVVALLRHPMSAGLRSSGATLVERTAAGFAYRSRRLQTGVTLPNHSDGRMTVTRHEGAITLRLRGASPDVEGAVLNGLVAYPGALGAGTTVYHRPLASGGDDELIRFARRPTKSRVTYEVEAQTGVSAFVLRGRVVDAVGADGRALFRMRSPFVVDAKGVRRDVSVSLENCGAAALGRDHGGCKMQLAWPEDLSYPAVLDPEWEPTGAMSSGRGSHTATRLDDGRVLVVGGTTWDNALGELAVSASAEIYEPVAGTWTPTSAMGEARSGHTSILMPNGKVLVAGGRDATGSLASAEVFDPTTETWSPAASMATARSGHDMIEAWNWSPMVAGGFLGTTALASTEVFDLTTQTWSAVGSMATPRGYHRLAELPGKQILAISGRSFSTGWTPSIEIYDPATEAWSAFASLAMARIDHTATRLRDGRVLVTGGVSSTGAKLSSVEIVDPSGVVTAAPDMAAARYGHTATLLQTGKVLVVGGECDLPTCTERSEEYDPALDVWEPSASIYQHPPLRFHASTLLENGKVLTSGGLNLTLGPTEDSTYASGSLYDAQRCKPPGLAGFVVGSITSAPSSLDLTAEGETDWSYEIDGTTHHKSGVGMITPLSDVGAPTKAMRGSGSTTYSWADGEPDPSRTTDLVLGFSGALGDGYAISFPTSPALRIAKLRLGALSGAGLLRVELSGNACSFYEAVVQDTSKEVSLLYMSPNAGDWLTARFTLLEAGELAAEGMSLRSAPLAATMFETDEDPTKSSFIVRVDNPLVTSRLKLDLTPTVWAGVVPEWVNASSGGVEMYNGDFGYLASGGEASPNANNTAPGNAGALDDSFFSWPNATGTFTAATAADEFTAHGRGLRVGYSPMNVEPRKTLPDLTTASTGPPVSVQLDTNVHLVPIQVIVVSSTNFPKNTRLTDQLALFDQIQNPEVFNITYGGELVKTTKAFAGVVNGTLPWMNPSDEGLYNVIGFDTPDSAWRSCGIQFRLVNYFEVLTDKDKYVFPLRGTLADGPITEEHPKFNTHYSSSAPDSTPCVSTLGLAGTDPRFVSGMLTVVYMQRSGFSDSPEDGRAVSGGACVRRGAPRNALAHELGHIMLAPSNSAIALDCDCANPECRMMCSFGGGASPPTASECAGARTWAQSRSAVFR